MTSHSASYARALHKMLEQHFDLEEVRTLCFELEVDYDNLRGEGKSSRNRELIMLLARQGRLPALVALARKERPSIIWPSVPDDFALPTTPEWSGTPVPTQNIYQGDVVYGDKTAGDKVGGDKISVGNISGSQGIAIGRGAQASLQIQQGIPTDEFNKLFAPLLAQVTQQVSARQQAEAVAKVNELKAETGKGEAADDEAVASLIEDIVALAPGAVATLTNLFTNALIAKSAGAATKYILKRVEKRS